MPYPLRTLLTLREQGKQSAELELAACRERLAERTRELERVQAELAAQSDKRRALLSERNCSGAELFACGMRSAHFSLLHAKLVQEERCAQLAVQAESRALRLAGLSLQTALAEHTAIERHHERFDDAARKAAMRAENDELSDSLATRHHARRTQ